MALEDRAVAGLALGHHGTVAAELEALTAALPAARAAVGAAGARADAAGPPGRRPRGAAPVRDVLDEELGLEPGAELRDLQTAVLRQDPALDWVAPPSRRTRPGRAARRPAPAPRPGRRRAASPPWPLVGREQPTSPPSTEALARAVAGSPTYAVLTGEPGIGKSRLAAELALRARRPGARVLVGRCSQDDGAPPLWPWRAGAPGARRRSSTARRPRRTRARSSGS